MPFGIDPKEISYVVASVKWIVQALQLIAQKLQVELSAPPQETD